MYKIAIDAMGGDNAPQSVIGGIKKAHDAFDDVHFVVVGQEDVVLPLLGTYAASDRVQTVNAAQVISNNEHPVNALRRKRDSSIVVAFNMLKNKEVDAFVSAGSTGAVLAGAQLIVRTVPGIRRCALAPVIPTTRGPAVLIDCGANVDSKPEDLVQYAFMGSIYAQALNMNTRIGLINIGAEEEKGNDLTKEAYKLLEASPLNFIGNVEARDIPFGDADVLVCDAFVGNVVVKLMEGMASALFTMLKEEMMAKFVYQIGAGILKPALVNFKKRMDYSEYGGAPLLGANGCIIKTHGSSDETAIFSTIRQAREYIGADITNIIAEKVQTLGLAITK